MTYTMEWYQPEQILLIKMSSDVTIEDAQDMNRELINHLDNTSNRLHLLFDFADVSGVPMNIHKANETHGYLRHPRLGWVVVYGIQNSFVKMLGSIVTQIWKVRTRFFTDYGEALEFLEDQIKLQQFPPAIDEVE